MKAALLAAGAVLAAMGAVSASTSQSIPFLLQPHLRTGQVLHFQTDDEVHLPGGAVRGFKGNMEITVAGERGHKFLFHATQRMNSGATAAVEMLYDPTTGQITPLGNAATSPRVNPGIAAFYDPKMVGIPPSPLAVGQTWTVSLPEPWAFGPAGSETVRVAAIDGTTVQLDLTGHGTGPSYQQIHHPPRVTGSSGGQTVVIPQTFGNARWSGTLTLVQGITKDETLRVRQTVTDGQTAISPRRTETQEWVLHIDQSPGA